MRDDDFAKLDTTAFQPRVTARRVYKKLGGGRDLPRREARRV